jgi:predicted Rossmann fold nucleotide-binding protein DprA/Smf involved in DNA uptake
MVRRPAQPTDSGEAPSVRTFAPEDLLGPLNPLELLHTPKQLFAAGHTEWLRERPRVSIVGSRKPSPDGLKRAAKLARVLTNHGALIVSGLAEGIDASVIVEAGEGGGSLSHGWEALRLGRPLFLMASILEQAELFWPKKMLDYGAMVLRDPSDLLAGLPAHVDDPLSAIAS